MSLKEAKCGVWIRSYREKTSESERISAAMENITIIAAIAAIDVQMFLPIARWLSIGRKRRWVWEGKNIIRERGR